MIMNAEGLGILALGNADRAAAIAAINAYLRIEHGAEDTLIAGLGETALGLAEQFIGAVLVVRTITITLPVVAGWQRLPVAPVRSITGVSALASDGSVAALPLADYAVDIAADGTGWVRLIDAGGARAVQVACTAGVAGDWASLAPPIRQGVVLLAGYLFRERDATGTTPAEVAALWRPFRRLALAEMGPGA